MKKVALLSAAFLSFGSLASASLIPTLGSITASGNLADPFQWNYNVALSSDEQLNPADTSTAPVPGTFFTLYDVSSTTPIIVGTPTGWTASTQLSGITPSGISPSDSSSLWDVTYTYTGAPLTGPSSFTGFSLDFAGNAMALGQFSFQATQFNNTITNGTTDNGKGFSIIPAVATPEPTTLSLIGFGLVGLAFVRRKIVRS